MNMMKELNVIAPLRKEMSELAAKRSSLPFGSAEWVAINARWNELLAIKSQRRIDNIETDLAKGWIV
jgi:hypothetical protein